ncbi:hypothetical protein [Pseudomonas protegens]|uniref:hypothetical protein n=1 Tax=Pseudomonas protegens TaxID=380021 RepID=UPI0011CDE657|nr:hypothetical protein [Pseudomonas protegens]
MKLNRAGVTSFILSAANRFPCFFSKKLRFVAKSYFEQESMLDAEFRKFEAFTRASLFSGHIQWTGVSFVFAVSKGELERITAWMQRRGLVVRGSSSQRRRAKISELFGSGCLNLGLVAFGKEYFGAAGKVKVSSSVVNDCVVSALKFGKGVYYVSLHVSLSEEAGSKVFDVDVSNTEGSDEFMSFNPFSSGFSVILSRDKTSVVYDAILKSFHDIFLESQDAVFRLLSVWGVKKYPKELSTTAIFLREGEGGYFTEGKESKSEESFVVWPNYEGTHVTCKVANDVNEDYMEGLSFKEGGVDSIYIRSRPLSEFKYVEGYDFFERSITEGYAYFSVLNDVYRQLEECVSLVNPIFFSYDKNTDENLRVLIDAQLKLNLVKERLAAVSRGASWVEVKYHEFLRERISNISKDVSELRDDVEKRAEINNGELQLTNIKWTKKYSILVGILVFAQIILALLNVSWSGGGLEGNPIYTNSVLIWRWIVSLYSFIH